MIITEAVPEPTLVSVEALPTAVVRHEGLTVADLPSVFDAAFPALGASGASLAGPAFAHYLGDPRGVFDLEIGFPVSEPLTSDIAGEPTIRPSTLPIGEALALTHVGSYDTLPESWERLSAAAQTQGLTPTGSLEVYVTMPTPDTDPATLRSDLFLLIAPRS